MAKNDLTKPTAADLSLDQDYAAELLGGLLESRTTVMNTGGGKPLLRMVNGVWLFGQGDDLVQQGSHWAVNVKTLGWGWVCWTDYKGQKNKRLGLEVVSMTKPRPPHPNPIEGFPFVDFITFDAVCLDGEDEGLEVTYGSNSMGGLRAFHKLRDAIIGQLQRDIRAPCPVITLSSESYKGNYGINYNPIWTITGWADLGGNLAPPEATSRPVAPPPLQTAAAVPAEPVRKRKAPLGANGDDLTAAAVAAGEVDPGPMPASTQQVHTGQRRRHRPAS